MWFLKEPILFLVIYLSADRPLLTYWLLLALSGVLSEIV